jgi:hypothetical protein
VIGEVLAGVLEVLARLQQGLRGDAADVGAGAGQAQDRPVSFFHSSMQAVWKPSWAARMAATYPPGPPPITTTSNFLLMVTVPSDVEQQAGRILQRFLHRDQAQHGLRGRR